MTCEKCGAQLPEGAKICPECGFELPEEISAAAEEAAVAAAAAEDEVTRAAEPEDQATQAVSPEEDNVFGQPKEAAPMETEDPMAQKTDAVVVPKKAGGNGGKTAVIVIVAVLLVAAIGFGAWWFLSHKKDDNQDKEDTTVSQDASTEAPTDKEDSTEPTDKEDPTEAPTEKEDPSEATDPTEAPTEAPTEKPTEAPTEAPTEPVKKTYRTDKYAEMFKSGEFQMTFTTDDETFGKSPVTAAVKDGNMMVAMEMEGMGKMRLLHHAKDNKTYMVMESLKMYTEMTEELMGEDLDISEIIDSFSVETSNAKIKESTEKVDGKTLYCESAKTSDGFTTRYYYDGDDLVRIETEDGNGGVSVTKISNISGTVDDSTFDIPKGCQKIDLATLSKLMG